MAFFTFACDDCGKSLEVKATLSEKEKGLNLTCPSCGSQNMSQLFQPVAIGSAKKEPAARTSSMPSCAHQGCACFQN